MDIADLDWFKSATEYWRQVEKKTHPEMILMIRGPIVSMAIPIGNAAKDETDEERV